MEAVTEAVREAEISAVGVGTKRVLIAEYNGKAVTLGDSPEETAHQTEK
ncbi:MAG: hypothetical protein JW712_04810 [Dehalococcoidales bacterium]|nr:hypothetical protein [Dehalococcoidales bacterium]